MHFLLVGMDSFTHEDAERVQRIACLRSTQQSSRLRPSQHTQEHSAVAPNKYQQDMEDEEDSKVLLINVQCRLPAYSPKKST